LLPGSCAQRRTPRFLDTVTTNRRVSSILIPLCFIHLQTPFPQTVYFHIYTKPWGVRPSVAAYSGWLRPPCALCCAFSALVLPFVFNNMHALFSLGSLSTAARLCFQPLAASFAKTPGVGTSTQLSLQVGNLRTLPGDGRGHASLRKGSPAPSTLAFRVSHFDFRVSEALFAFQTLL
jgi:hypothetical protein